MEKEKIRVLFNILRKLLPAISIIFIIIFLATALVRLNYSYELEWMEGGMVDHVQYVMDGRQIYSEPDVEFTPFIYPPLYYYISAGVAAITGIGFFPLRLVSIIATVLSFWLIYLFIKRETGDGYYGILGAGLFAATYEFSGAWFDLARVDSLFVMFLLLTFYLLRFRHKKTFVLAGLSATAAFLTKQSAIIIIAPVLVYEIITEKKLSIYFISIFILFSGGAFLSLNSLTDGWFSYYIFKLPAAHELMPEKIYSFWIDGIFMKMSIAFFLATAYFIIAKYGEKRNDLWFYFSVIGGTFIYSWSSLMHSGGFSNVLIPSHAALAVLFGIAYKNIDDNNIDILPNSRINVQIVLALLILGQYAQLTYHPLKYTPNSDDREAAEKYMETLESLESPVYVPIQGYIPKLAGHKTHAHSMALYDVIRGDKIYGELLEKELAGLLENHYFNAIIRNESWHEFEIEEYYKLKEKIINDKNAFMPKTGLMVRPNLLYVPYTKSNGKMGETSPEE